MNQVNKAKMVAYWFHRDQTDMSGVPYVHHLRRVAAPFQGEMEWETAAAVAWLHDVVEDTECTLRDLFELGFSDDIVMAVDAITQRPGEDLEDYWLRCKANVIARVVKVKGDIPDNSDERRLDYLPPHLADKLRLKYQRAMQVLGYDYVA